LLLGDLGVELIDAALDVLERFELQIDQPTHY
jgi:hypothetical protein